MQTDKALVVLSLKLQGSILNIFFSEMISKYFDMSNTLVNNMPQTCPNHHHDIRCKANKPFSAFARTADN